MSLFRSRLFLALLFAAAAPLSASCSQDDGAPPPADNVDAPLVSETSTAHWLCSPSDCDHTISSGGFRKLSGQTTPVNPGARVCISSGQLTGLQVEDLHGTAAMPIEIVNCGGQVTIGALPGGSSNGFSVLGSSHLKITGTGHTGYEHGIKIDGTASQGLSIAKLSTDIEVEYLEVTNAGFAGIMAKTDPGCDGYATKGTFTQYNTVFHDNYIHDVKGEGFYIGHSFYYGYTKNNSCLGTVLYPHELIGVKVYNNVVKNTGADGIQVGSAVQDVEIHDNLVDGYGQDPFASYQDNGMQIGEGTTGNWYNNTIRNGPGNAMIVIGLGDISIFNNEMKNTQGIYIHKNASPGDDVAILNNTFVDTKVRGISTPNTLAAIKVHNNIMVHLAGVKPINRENASVNLVDSHNLFTQDIQSVGFVNPAAGDYHITAASPAKDAGLNVPVAFDHDGASRSDGKIDIGAYEHVATGVVFAQSFDGSSVVSDYVGAPPSLGQLDDIGAEATGGTFTINSGRLQIARAGSSTSDNDAGLTRSTDLAGAPSVLHFTFDVGALNWTVSTFQSNALCLDIGSFTGVFDYASAGPLGDVFDTRCINGKGSGKFTFGASSTLFNADGTLYKVSYFLNKSGAAKTYKAPDGTMRGLQSNGIALWVGTTVLFDDVPANSNGASSALTDFRVRWGNPENATWLLDNFLVKGSLPQ